MTRDLLIKALSFLTSVGLAVSGYFLADTYAKMDDMRKDITQLQLHAERVDSNKFSPTDFMKAREVIDSQLISTDRRIIALEEGQKTIKEYLTEMRTDIKDIKKGRQGF